MRRFLLPLLFLLPGCVSRSAALYDYLDVQYADSRIPSTDMAVVLILVDGLSVDILQRGIRAGKVPALNDYFLGEGGKVHLGRAIFPSITYPNISSILTARPVDGHPIVGNQMRYRGEFLNFEKPQHRDSLNDALGPLTVFNELTERGLKSVSFAHYFRAGATVHYHSDVESALSYLKKDYALADEKLTSSLEKLLLDVPERAWPFFTFLHVAGVDSLAHDHGPEAAEVQAYLQRLDATLAPIFRLLRNAEAKGKKVTVLLTADHGFEPLESVFNVERFLAEVAPGARVLNETRFASIYFERGEIAESRENIVGALESNPEIEMLLERRGNRIHLDSAQLSAVIEYIPRACPTTSYGVRLEVAGAKETLEKCPEELDSFYAPSFISGIASYFQNPAHPDALLLAAPGVGFAPGQKGGHGGITLPERQVPILLHGATIRDESVALPTYELLKPLWRKAETRSRGSDQTVPRSGRY